MLKILKQLFCKHEPYGFRALNDPTGLVCKKCGKNYRAV
jgi:hypothetical protein